MVLPETSIESRASSTSFKENEQLHHAKIFAAQFRNGRSLKQFLKDEFAVSEHVLLDKRGAQLLQVAFVVPGGPDALSVPPQQQWTTTSSLAFLWQDVEPGKHPFLAPSAYFDDKPEYSHLSLPALCEKVFRMIPESGKHLASWSGPEPFVLYWNNIQSQLIYSPSNAEKWRDSLSEYLHELRKFLSSNGRESKEEMKTLLGELGLSGFWQEFQSGSNLVDSFFETGLLYESIEPEVLWDPLPDTKLSPYIEVELVKMGRAFDKLKRLYQNDPTGLQLIEQPIPVLVPVVVPQHDPVIMFVTKNVEEQAVLHYGIRGLSDSVSITSPIRNPSIVYPWRKGIKAENIDQNRVVYVPDTTEEQVRMRIQETLGTQMGVPIEVVRLHDVSRFVSDCKLPYFQNPYTLEQSRRDMQNGRLVPLLNPTGSESVSLFSFEESLDFLLR